MSSKTGRPVLAVWAILATVLGAYAAGHAATDAQDHLHYNCWTLSDTRRRARCARETSSASETHISRSRPTRRCSQTRPTRFSTWPAASPSRTRASSRRVRARSDGRSDATGACSAKDPRLPFIVRKLSVEPGPGRGAGLTFFIPTRYRSLRNEPSLISGTLTIVGKVVYRNLGRSAKGRGGQVSCGKVLPASVPRSYVDRQTVATFVPALVDAPPFVIDGLRFTDGTIEGHVRRNMTVPAPVVVVIPIAMYQ